MRRIHLATLLPLRQCDEDFARMSSAPGGRRCDACDHVVHDLSAMRESEATRLVHARQGQRTCYRYLARADGTIVYAPEPERPRLAAAVAVAVALAACTPHAPPQQIAAGEEAAVAAPASAPAPIVIPPAPTAPAKSPEPPEPPSSPELTMLQPCDAPVAHAPAQPAVKAKKAKPPRNPAPPAKPEKPVEYLGFEG